MLHHFKAFQKGGIHPYLVAALFFSMCLIWAQVLGLL